MEPSIAGNAHQMAHQRPADALALVRVDHGEGDLRNAGLLDDVLTADNLSTAFGQSITLDVLDGRYFARRVRSRAAHRRRA